VQLGLIGKGLRNLILWTILRHKKRLNSLKCNFIFISRRISAYTPTTALVYDLLKAVDSDNLLNNVLIPET